MCKSILFVTGTRADFGKLEPLAKAARDRGLDVSFFVTGMHMLERYGLTKNEIARVEGVNIFELINHRHGDTQDIILSKTIVGFSDFITERRPDLVVIHGDRIEALACALVCSTNYILSAHIEGGEVSGTIDETLRHCNTKLCNHHFVSSKSAANRVMALGEAKESIHVIGSPEMDFHAQNSGVSIQDVKRRYGIKSADYGICIFHPVTSEIESMEAQANGLFRTLDKTEKDFVVICPNNDPGSEHIMSAINRLPKSKFTVLPSMRFSYFSELMKNASCMIGNSSAGVREAPFLGIPSLDIGSRQFNRGNAHSVFYSNANNSEMIQHFISSQWGKKYKSSGEFGSGNATEKFLNTILQKEFWNVSLQKIFTDSG